MSDSALAAYTAISPNCNRPRSQPISKITVHHMAGNTTLEAFGALVGKTSRQMSANYAIESSGRIGLFCHEADRSWCSSSPWNDQRAITIEVANDSGAPDWHVSDKAYAALLDLCTDICRRNGIKKLTYTGDKNGSLTMHCFYAATACPGPYLKSKFPDIAAQVTTRLKGGVADAAPAKTQEQTFIDVMAEKCQSRCLNAHLLPSLCIAQACLESAYGTSELAVQANNLFGIKASNWSGRVYNKATKEWDGSKYITITAGFRAYDGRLCRGLHQEADDHAALLEPCRLYRHQQGVRVHPRRRLGDQPDLHVQSAGCREEVQPDTVRCRHQRGQARRADASGGLAGSRRPSERCGDGVLHHRQEVRAGQRQSVSR